MQIRSARPTDLEALVAVDPITQREPSRRRSIEAAIRSGECWVADSSGGPVGFVVLQYTFYGNGFVPLLVVQQSIRRQGVGRALLEHAASLCSTPKLFTSTNESNTAMRSLLAALAFEPSGVIHNLDPGDPEHVYMRRLRPDP
jgi:ribosomal protein S18 acetylase RimI-like enzyme